MQGMVIDIFESPGCGPSHVIGHARQQANLYDPVTCQRRSGGPAGLLHHRVSEEDLPGFFQISGRERGVYGVQRCRAHRIDLQVQIVL